MTRIGHMAGAPLRLNAFTVDLEDWFQGLTSTNPLVERWPYFESRVVPATTLLLDILRRHKVQATFFTLGYVATRYPALIEAISADGHDIGLHGYFHRHTSQLTPDEFTQELERNIQAIELITGERPLGYRAPYFSIDAATLWALDLLEAQGICYDSSFFPTRNMLYGFPTAPRFPHRPDGHALVEFPLSTVRLGGLNWPMAGGFYLRSWPYPFIRWGISRLNDQGQPAIMYIHPWELDLGQRYDRVTLRERITHYHGRRLMAEKLERLFTDFRFGSLCALFEQYQHLRQEAID